uniref:Uncharacterized protein n=1 Tax=Oryza nivara TaxID=4536 RepID=A0A0E0GL09_ORYNI
MVVESETAAQADAREQTVATGWTGLAETDPDQASHTAFSQPQVVPTPEQQQHGPQFCPKSLAPQFLTMLTIICAQELKY